LGRNGGIIYSAYKVMGAITSDGKGRGRGGGGGVRARKERLAF